MRFSRGLVGHALAGVSTVHQPNVDAMNYFMEEIWPILRKQLPDVTLYIVGSNMPEEVKRWGAVDGVQSGSREFAHYENVVNVLASCEAPHKAY